MADNRVLYAGVDIGASRTKVALLDNEKNLRGFSVKKSGTDFSRTAEESLTESLTMANASRDAVTCTVSTGYGRTNAAFSNHTRTEIACHAKGAFHYFQTAMTIIDIGGQDNKVIKLDSEGRRTNFKMNRKCAAGTGAFLEEMSARLDIPIEEMDRLARVSTEMVVLGSFCTVFSATEVLEKIRQGKKVPDIIKGLFYSVIKRVLEMDLITPPVVMTGGVVEHNPYLVEMVREEIGSEILLPGHPQLAGAIGAALFAMEL
ncbi:MAG: ATPase [Deltaproteobacteria bacterium]|jgi:predicted CoA-substrate-specific enzyme activase|nr:ATPase [Deltaproteobacteria bacterium]